MVVCSLIRNFVPIMANDKIRIKDIAKRAGVSVGTVDRVLHKRPNVSPKSLEKVNKALEEMDYQPNMYASALAYNKRYTFYCIIPKHASEAYWEEIEEGADAACERRSDFGISVKMIYYKRFQPETFVRATNEVLKQKPDGVIVVPSTLELTRKFTDQLHEQQVPFILLDSYMAGTVHSAGLLHARPSSAVVLRSGLVPERILCCTNADADCSEGKGDYAHEADA